MSELGPQADSLRSFVDDVTNVLSTSAMWRDRSSTTVLSVLCDTVMRLLRLEFVYARWAIAAGAPPIECVHVAHVPSTAAHASKLAGALAPWLALDRRERPDRMRNPVEDGDVALASATLGTDETAGVIVAGSRRTGFPSRTETLLFEIAALRAAVQLQATQLTREEERCTDIEQANDRLQAENASLRGDLPRVERTARSSPPATGDTLEAVERNHILRVLDDTKWVISGPHGAASRLGLKRTSLQYRMKKLGISRPH